MIASEDSSSNSGSPRRLRAGHALVGGFMLAVLLGIAGVASFFTLSADTAALRTSAIASVPSPCEKRIALHVGGITAGIARGISRFFDLPPEGRAAFDSFHGGEVGLYSVEEMPPGADLCSVMKATDKTMLARGWNKLVGVVKEGQLVCVYVPARKLSARRMRCCLVVLNREQLILAAAHANLEPLLALAQRELDSQHHSGPWLLR